MTYVFGGTLNLALFNHNAAHVYGKLVILLVKFVTDVPLYKEFPIKFCKSSGPGV